MSRPPVVRATDRHERLRRLRAMNAQARAIGRRILAQRCEHCGLTPCGCWDGTTRGARS